MNRLTSLLGALLFACAVAPQSSHATIILQDDFTGNAGNTVDSTKWNTTTVTPSLLDGSGNAVVDPSGSKELLAKSSFFEAPTLATGNEIKLTFVLASDFTNLGRFGLTDGAGHGVDMDTEISGGAVYFHVAPTGGGDYFYTFGEALSTAGSAGTWLFDWMPGRIVVSKNGSTVIDTAVTNSNNPIPGTPFAIPTVPMGPFALKDSGATVLVSSVLFEDAALIPEPSTVLLLGLGGLLLWRQRKPRTPKR